MSVLHCDVASDSRRRGWEERLIGVKGVECKRCGRRGRHTCQVMTWRCDGCDFVGSWDDRDWRTWGSFMLEDLGVTPWLACSDECAALMPEERKAIAAKPRGYSARLVGVGA